MSDERTNKRVAGEPWVWLTGMGLAVGLMMVFCLLMVIAVNGLEVFWPKRVLELTLIDGSKASLSGSNKLCGVLVRKQEKRSYETSEQPSGQPIRERQLYVANKDAYGLSFRFIDEADIVNESLPDDLMMIERLEYGKAIGFPQKIVLKNRAEIVFGDREFDDILRGLVHKSNDRRSFIKEIEKHQIGKINSSISKLRLSKRVLEKKEALSLTEEDRLIEIQESIDALQADYEVLATRSQTLRAEQDNDKFIYKLVTGEEREIAAGDIVHYYYPNKLTFLGRVRLFFINFWRFLVEDPREANTEGGIFPAIFGTFVMTIMMSFAVTPFGVLAAIYLREYAKQGAFVRSVRIAVNNLAGVPSIVFGVFGLGFFVYLVGGSIDRFFFADRLPTPTFGTGGIFWASLTLALMTIPVVIVATEESLASVPRGTREGSLALGASKWQTIQRVVLPAAAPGIMTGFILAMARGAGEVAPLMIVGVVKLAPSLPLDGIFPFIHLERKFMHLGFHIYDLGFQSPDSEAAKPMVFATTFVLIALVVSLNLTAIIIRNRIRSKNASGTF